MIIFNSNSNFIYKIEFCIGGIRAVLDEELIAAHHGTKLSIDIVGYLEEHQIYFNLLTFLQCLE
jgi:hypothetical protein